MFPYSGYDQFDFDIPVGSNGDVYDRYLVRMLEMGESLKIVQQALDGMPEGPYQISDRKVVPPPKWAVATNMEALIHHFKLYTEGYRPPKGEVYQRIEAPKGELGYYLVSDGTARALSHARPSAILCKSGGAAHHGAGRTALGYYCSDWQHRYRAGRSGSMTC